MSNVPTEEEHPPIHEVRIVAPTQLLSVGRTVQLSATAHLENGARQDGAAFAWVSTHPHIAAVDGGGVVTALTPGRTTIRVAAGDQVASVEFEVIPVSGLRLLPQVTHHVIDDPYAVGSPFALTAPPATRLRVRGTAPGAVRLKAYTLSPPNFRTPDVTVPLTGESESPEFDIFLPNPFNILHLVAHDASGDSVGHVSAFISTQSPQLAVASNDAPELFAPSGASSVELKLTAWARSPISRISIKVDRGPIQEIPILNADSVVEVRWPAPLTDSITMVWTEVETASGHTWSTSTAIGRQKPATEPGAYRQIARSGQCALNAVGRVYCWGGSPSMLSPQPVVPDLSFASISGVNGSTCGLTTAGSAYCWGPDLRAVEVGNGQISFHHLSAGNNTHCGIAKDFRAYCWGGGWGSSVTPVGGDMRFLDIAPGDGDIRHNCALDTEGTAYCWGSNLYGQLGLGSAGPAVATPGRVQTTEKFVDIAVDPESSCALTEDGRVFCWGRVARCHAGDTVTCSAEGIPMESPADLRFTSLDFWANAICGLTERNEAYCWENGSLKPPAPLHPSMRFVSVAVTSTHRCGVMANGATYCWGRGGGYLGNGTRNGATYPVRVIDRF